MTAWSRAVRVGVGFVGVAMLIGGIVLIPIGGLAGLWVIVMGGALVVAALFEASRYRTAADGSAPRDGFRPTDEVFLDPTTGVRTRVWSDARTGERRYEPES
jgi:hypothetical protein